MTKTNISVEYGTMDGLKRMSHKDMVDVLDRMIASVDDKLNPIKLTFKLTTKLNDDSTSK